MVATCQTDVGGDEIRDGVGQGSGFDWRMVRREIQQLGSQSPRQRRLNKVGKPGMHERMLHHSS